MHETRRDSRDIGFNAEFSKIEYNDGMRKDEVEALVTKMINEYDTKLNKGIS